MACKALDEEIFRVLYYDCAPYNVSVRLPVSGTEKKFEVNSWLEDLSRRGLFAVRKGILKFRGFKPKKIRVSPGTLSDHDFDAVFEQKGDEMRRVRPGLPERRTHDYKRHGTTTLFAAFNILNGKVIGTCQDRHRSRKFIPLLNHLEAQLPVEQEVHLIMDNYCTHKCAEVQRWLKPKKRRRFHFHFTPTSSSWLNQVERFFALITGRMIRHGTFHSTDELEQVIYKWLATWNGEPTPFVWRASADVILDKVRRCKESSETGG